jgi:hypothetical protein
MKNILFSGLALLLGLNLGLSGCATSGSSSRGLASERADGALGESFSDILIAGGGVALAGAAMSCGMAYRALTAESEEIRNAEIYKQLDGLIEARIRQGNLAADGEFAELIAARKELADAVRRGDLTLDELKQLGKRVEGCFVR